MSINVDKSMLEMMQEVIAMLPEGMLKETIAQTIAEKNDKLETVEAVFRKICSNPYPPETMSHFFNGWKATHLKMLPIYGLSCRLNILGMASENPAQKTAYLEASAYNAATSHEDLGIGFDAVSHGRLYDDFAFALLRSDAWKRDRYATAEADAFSEWIYRGMLLGPIPYALCINMISEFYNHAEYAYSYRTFKHSMEQFYHMDGRALEDAIRYIDVHNEHETEIHHFLAVIDSIRKYEAASGEKVQAETLTAVIHAYVDRICDAMTAIGKKFD